MRETDILIAGGGLAGSMAAAMLARAGFGVVLVDLHAIHPPEFRCEKLISRQVDILRRTGLADLVLPAATLDGECWIADFGRVVEKRPAGQWGILYDTLVNTVRAAIPAGTPFIRGKVTQIANSPCRQTVTLSTGEDISARLVVVANGLNSGLRQSLGMVHEVASKCHSVSLAFDLHPVASSGFEFGALTYFSERATDRIAYITLFPIGTAMRANLFAYRDMDDPWLRQMRVQPDLAMGTVMPGLRRLIGSTEIVGPVTLRPADLYVTGRQLQPGVVLVGDAFASSCPVTGTGADKVFTDVERLCNVHVPRWMATRGMGVEKIGAFYADPVKVACDRRSFNKAFSARSDSTDEGLPWRARRWARFVGRLAMGTARGALAQVR